MFVNNIFVRSWKFVCVVTLFLCMYVCINMHSERGMLARASQECVTRSGVHVQLAGAKVEHSVIPPLEDLAIDRVHWLGTDWCVKWDRLQCPNGDTPEPVSAKMMESLCAGLKDWQGGVGWPVLALKCCGRHKQRGCLWGKTGFG